MGNDPYITFSVPFIGNKGIGIDHVHIIGIPGAVGAHQGHIQLLAEGLQACLRFFPFLGAHFPVSTGKDYGCLHSLGCPFPEKSFHHMHGGSDDQQFHRLRQRGNRRPALDALNLISFWINKIVIFGSHIFNDVPAGISTKAFLVTGPDYGYFAGF